jgi:hypothetical protein
MFALPKAISGGSPTFLFWKIPYLWSGGSRIYVLEAPAFMRGKERSNYSLRKNSSF